MAKTLVMSPERVRRTLSRLAHQVVERNRGAERVEVIGIRQRGVAVARALKAEIETVTDRTQEAHELDITPYRDDRERGSSEEGTSVIHRDLTDRDVILVDDVLFTGRTARAALDAIVHYGRPRSIQLVVLIDRGHREYPIQPDYVGRTLPTKHGERVTVVEEEQGTFTIYADE